MSGYPFNQNGHGSASPGNDYFAGFDAFNTLINSGIPNVTQPAFGQSWAGGWNSVPADNNDVGSPFQYGFIPGNGFDSNRQIDTQVYSEDDDFYQNDGPLPVNPTEITVNSNERSKASLPSPASKQLPLLNSAMVALHASTPAVTTQSNLNDVSPSAPKPTNLTQSRERQERMDELRAKLLASKRARSTTPLVPPAPSKSNPSSAVSSVSEVVRSSTVESPAQNHKNSKPNDEKPAIEPDTVKNDDKFPPYSPMPPTKPPANADIQGLIDEYRASEAVKGPKTPSKASIKGLPPKPPAGLKNIEAASERSGTRAVPQSVITNGPSKPQSGSPGSSESGEIRSDQEQEAVTAGTEPGSIIALPNSRHRNDSHSTVNVHTTDKLGQSKPESTPTDPSKPKAAPSTSRQDLPPQIQDRRKSVQRPSESRNIPLAQRVEQPRRKPSLPSTPARPGRRETLSIIETEEPTEAPRHDAGYGRESKEKADDQLRVSSRPGGGASAASDRPLRKLDQKHDTRISDGSAMPVRSESQLLRPHTQIDTPSAVSDQSTILSLPQQEQIQRLGIDLTPEGLRDLSDFLDFQHFFVKEYREGFLARQRRLRALEEEKVALERESLMQYELFNSIRAQSLAAREQSEPGTVAGFQSQKETNETSSSKPMPPPLSLPRKTNVGGTVAISGRDDATEAALTTNSIPRTNGQLPSHSVLDGSNLKRRHLDDDVDVDRGSKFIRIDSDSQYRNKSRPVSPRTMRTEPQTLDQRRPSDFRAVDYGYPRRSRSPDDRRRSPSPQRRASDHNYSSRHNSWTAPYNQGQHLPRPSTEELRRDNAGTLCRTCHRIGHYTFDCPDTRRRSGSRHPVSPNRGNHDHDSDGPRRPSRGNHSFSSASFRGGSRGRAGYYSKSFRRGSTPFKSSPARQEAGVPKGSESLNLKAGGQSRSTSFSADLP